MSQENERHEITLKPVVYRIPGMDAVTIRRDVEYRATETGALTMDIYYPTDSQSGAQRPAVVIVAGFPDLGFETKIGCQFKEMESCISWGKLMAASGLVAITYTNREPAADLQALLEYVRQNAAPLGIDENNLGLWASSGNAPLALSVLMQEGLDYLRCAVLCYGYMLDLEGDASVAEASELWGFANPCAGKSVEDLPQHLPLFIARAGLDQILHLNETIDRFISKALTRNLPITLTNHPEAPHSFDLLHDSETSREVIRQILSFMRFHLLS
ncbi:MAG TPA: alpha/beta hydrolase [Pyrinomonadaceae bacterium]|jgi:hypothetical protein